MPRHRTAPARHTPRYAPCAAALAVLLAAACVPATARRSTAAPAPTAATTAARGVAAAPTSGAAPAGRPAHAWAGTYDVVADGFPEGTRRAVFTVARRDTGHALVSLAGPPGRLTTAHFVGDSAHVLWDLGAEGAMRVWMRAAGDSVTGAWAVGDQQGLLHGRRRP